MQWAGRRLHEEFPILSASVVSILYNLELLLPVVSYVGAKHLSKVTRTQLA